jgi:hypothetical protein
MKCLRCLVLLFGIALATGCDTSEQPPPIEPPDGRCDNQDPLRKPLFGDTHVHTTLSLDANVRGTRLGPEDAYRFAKGERIGIQPYDEDGIAQRFIQLERPLDFVVVSDHAEWFGMLVACQDSSNPAYVRPNCELYREDPVASYDRLVFFEIQPQESVAYPELCGLEGGDCTEAGLGVWQDSQDAAEAANDSTPACEFSAFIGYEWTAGPGSRNLHRNVVFRNDIVPAQAISFFDEGYVEGLWERLRKDCIDAETGCDVLTIPHNPNLSDGLFFDRTDRDGNPFDAAYATQRARMEPLIEIYQHKGDSECLPGETISDELCGFEKLPFANFAQETVGIFGKPNPKDFIRAALGEGMKLEAELGTNPFKHGLIASTDTHISAPGYVPEDGYAGHGNFAGATATELPPGLVDSPYRSPGGLAVVWAEENSRESIFRAMRRRETYGTSGPRIVVRFFGGWSYGASLCDDPSFAERGYREGVPMGGDLTSLPSRSAAPRFAVSAAQDPGTPKTAGTPLQRIQIVKGWLDDGRLRVSVFDVAGNPDNGAAVDTNTCELDPGDGGYPSLCAIWTDTEFDPDVPAYYYARVIENPTCRWTTHACIEAEVSCDDPGAIPEGFEPCCDPMVPKTIQERAWTSPIWYTPSGD